MGRRRISQIVLGLTAGMLVAGLSAADEGPSRGLTIHRSGTTGPATFVTATDGDPIAVPAAAGKRAAEPLDFLVAHGHLFGVTDPAPQPKAKQAQTDWLGRTHTTFKQVHNGVSVFSGVLKIHQNPDGAVIVGNGDFYPKAERVNTELRLQPDAAAAIAGQAIGYGQPAVEHSELVIVDPGWYGDPPQGAHPAYYVILADLSVPMREAFFVDAQTGKILDWWDLLETVLYRWV